MKTEAKKHEKFSSFCILVGQQSHQISSRLTAIASGFKVIAINPLAEEEALSQGISFLSEFFVFSVAGGIIIVEFARSEMKSAQKAEQTKQAEAEFRQYLEDRFSKLDQKLETMAKRIETIEQKQNSEQEKQKEVKCVIISAIYQHFMLLFCQRLRQEREQKPPAAAQAFNPQKESWITWLWRSDH